MKYSTVFGLTWILASVANPVPPRVPLLNELEKSFGTHLRGALSKRSISKDKLYHEVEYLEPSPEVAKEGVKSKRSASQLEMQLSELSPYKLEPAEDDKGGEKIKRSLPLAGSWLEAGGYAVAYFTSSEEKEGERAKRSAVDLPLLAVRGYKVAPLRSSEEDEEEGERAKRSVSASETTSEEDGDE